MSIEKQPREIGTTAVLVAAGSGVAALASVLVLENGGLDFLQAMARSIPVVGTSAAFPQVAGPNTELVDGNFTLTLTPTPTSTIDAGQVVGTVNPDGTVTPPADLASNRGTFAVFYPSTGEVCKTPDPDKKSRQEALGCITDPKDSRGRVGFQKYFGMNVDSELVGKDVDEVVPAVGTWDQVKAYAMKTFPEEWVKMYPDDNNLQMNWWDKAEVMHDLDTKIGDSTAANMSTLNRNDRYFLFVVKVRDANGNVVEVKLGVTTNNCENEIKGKKPGPQPAQVAQVPTATPTPTEIPPLVVVVENTPSAPIVSAPTSAPQTQVPPPPANTSTPVPPLATPTEAPTNTPIVSATPQHLNIPTPAPTNTDVPIPRATPVSTANFESPTPLPPTPNTSASKPTPVGTPRTVSSPAPTVAQPTAVGGSSVVKPTAVKAS